MGFPKVYVGQYEYGKRKQLEAASEYFMLGILAKDDNDRNIIELLDSRYFNLTFIVEPLCDEPIPINDVTNDENYQYIGVDSQQDPEFLPPNYDDFKGYADRMDLLDNWLNNKLIIYKPSFRSSKHQDMLFKNLIIYDLIDLKTPGSLNYYVVPRVSMDYSAFDAKLRDGSYFNLVDYANDMRSDPEFILCGDFLFQNTESWEKHPTQNKMWRCKEYSRIRRFKVIDDIKVPNDQFFRASDNIYFLNSAKAQLIQERGEYKPDFGQPIKEELLTVEVTKKESITIEKVSEQIDLPSDESKETTLDEIKFLDAFKRLTDGANLIYEKKDLINLHICAKSNTITIIAGMSGTGKTQLALNYAKMLDSDEQNQTLLFLPISPSYTEPEDVLGYYSNTHRKYFPASTRLVDFLVHASTNKHKMHIVIFDEMNMSQIEHWFSPFMSILERELDERYLTLYSQNEECENAAIYPSQIKINENVVFIGTINLDETTKDVSDRLLDRSFVISLNKQKFIQYTNINDSIERDTDASIEDNKCRTTNVFDQWRKKQAKQLEFTNAELRFFDRTHEAINLVDSQKGVSFRALRNISNYLKNVPVNEIGEPIFPRKDSIDLLFKQTILSKLKGSEAQLSELLGSLDGTSKQISYGEIQKIFEEYKEVSHFTESKKEIERKLRDINQYGYTR